MSPATRPLAVLMWVCAFTSIPAHGQHPMEPIPWSDSPDGDPAVHEYRMPAAQLSLGAPGIEGTRPGRHGFRALPSEFVLTGQVPEGDTASGVTFTPDGTKIVVAHRDSSNLVVFEAATRDVVNTIPLSGSPNDVAVASDGIHAVTANVFEDTASIVDLSTGGEIAVVPVGEQPGVVRITPDGTTAVVGNTVDGDLSVIDIASATELRRIPGAGFVGTISANFESGAVTAGFSSFELADDTTLVHPDFYAHQIKIFDISDGSVTVLDSDQNPRAIALTPDGNTAVVAHVSGVQTISVVNVGLQVISKTIPVGADLGDSITIDPTGTKAVVEVLNACRVVNLVTDAVSANLDTASVNRLLTTADGSHALAVGFFGSLIDYSTESIVTNLNGIVSTAIGARSPVDHRAVMIANTFGEDMVVVNTNGSSGFIEDHVPSGPPPEGDKARDAAISPDGTTAVVLNIFSDNASIVDLASGSVEAIVDVGNRPSEVEITPDGTKAVVANLDSTFVSVIDLASHGVTNVPISTRGSQVEISPDGQYAYVSVVTADGVWRIDLASSSVAGPKLATGNMGGVGYMFNQSSGLTLSGDGATLVTCNSFSDSISIIDTASWSVAATVGVGDFPVRAIFAPNDSRIYVANRDDGTLARVSNNGAASVLSGTIAVGVWPFEMAIASDGRTLYVANFQDDDIGVVDLVSSTMTATIPLPDPPAGLELDPTETYLYAPSGNWSVSIGPGPAFSISLRGQFSRIEIASGSVVDQIVTDLPPAMSILSDAASVVVVPSPFGDGITVVDIEEGAVLGAGDIVDDPLLVAKLGGGDIELSWGDSCVTTDDDYAAYEGVVGSYYSHVALTCSTFGATSMAITPAAGSAYYLIVPTNSDREGSYGPDGEGDERPQGGSACLAREVGACP